ncbi:TolC family protein [Puniceicoccus vermicola]|uniref:TolC family protein n=1 Tax=Puniceicoccus vermicola TaxID=388746 RepID=A0A7X1B1E3_9BACT|nr:TolC family protein [Puniceicoccus vermicola]MBC2603684.1 TolC family protein [Puniceicoccus vermicola]
MHRPKLLSRNTLLFLFSISSLGAEPGSAFGQIGPEPIEFDQALQLALDNDPRYDLLAERRDAAEGQVEQAGVRPNPVVGAEAENFLGTGPVSGVKALEVTLGVTQVLETADKRRLRTEVERQRLASFDWEAEQLEWEIESEVREAFVAVLLAQQSVGLREMQLELAERSLSETQRLVEEARSPQVEKTRATLAVKRQEFLLRQSERDYESSRAVLAALWGMVPAPDFRVQGEIVLEEEIPSIEELEAVLPGTVILKRFESDRQQRQAALELEEARATPDIELYGGARYYNEDDGNLGFVAGVAVPWPLFDRNQGNIRSARAELRSVEYEREARRRELLLALNENWRELQSAHADARSIEVDLIPAARETLEATEEGYRLGRFTQVAVIDSRQELFALRESYLEALGRYAQALTAIKNLTRPATLTR